MSADEKYEEGESAGCAEEWGNKFMIMREGFQKASKCMTFGKMRKRPFAKTSPHC